MKTPLRVAPAGRLLLAAYLLIWGGIYLISEASPLLHYGIGLLLILTLANLLQRPWHPFNLVLGLYFIAACALYAVQAGNSLLPVLALASLGTVLLTDCFFLSPAPKNSQRLLAVLVFDLLLLLLFQLPFGRPLQAALTGLITASLLESPLAIQSGSWSTGKIYAILILLSSLVLALSLYTVII